MKLYSYWRSSSSFRVRVALNALDLGYEVVPIHLVRDGGEQYGEAYRAINPAARVPALVLDDGRVITQSLAIIEYLHAVTPGSTLIPADPILAARTRTIAHLIGCDMQPFHNAAVMRYITGEFGRDMEEFRAWVAHWAEPVLTGVEAVLAGNAALADGDGDGPSLSVSPGDGLSMADACIVGAMYSARRFGVDVAAYPHLCARDAALLTHPAVVAALPENQVDAPVVDG